MNCGAPKVLYPDRRSARRAARHLGAKGLLNAYPCGEGFHVGHFAPEAKVRNMKRASGG